MTDEDSIRRFVDLGRTHRRAELWGCPQQDVARLEHFRERVIGRPEAFLAELDAGLAARLEKLGDKTHLLAVLEATPDLFSPLRATHRETLHTGLLAWLLSPTLLTHLGAAPLRAFLTLLAGRAGEGAAVDPAWAEHPSGAIAEHVCGGGDRIDVLVELSGAVIAIEAKIEHILTDGQLDGYRKEANERARAGNRQAWVVFLAKDPGSELPGGDPAIGVSYRDLMQALLPVAASGDSGEHWILGAWMRTILGPILSLSGVGGFSSWNRAQQGATLSLIEGR